MDYVSSPPSATRVSPSLCRIDQHSPALCAVDPVLPLVFLNHLHQILEDFIGGPVTEASLKVSPRDLAPHRRLLTARRRCDRIISTLYSNCSKKCCRTGGLSSRSRLNYASSSYKHRNSTRQPPPSVFPSIFQIPERTPFSLRPFPGGDLDLNTSPTKSVPSHLFPILLRLTTKRNRL